MLRCNKIRAMNANAQSFGKHAQAYAAARPTYPEELFDWIASEAPARWAVLDVATGSGQAARALSERFATVHATDISPDQLAHAEKRSNIHYAAAEAEASALPDGTVDAVTVATALHWFDFPRFWAEVRRVSRPGGLFCAWTYGLIEGNSELHEHLLDPLQEVIDPYWAEGNRLSLRGYPRDEIAFPFRELTPPRLTMDMAWSTERLVAFLNSWSAMSRARAEGEAARIDALIDKAWGKIGEGTHDVSMPMTIIAGRID